MFRGMALALPEVEEGAHGGHPDFRVGGKVCATLVPAKGQAMVALTVEQQARAMEEHPGMFVPAAGAWGARGATMVVLARAKAAPVKTALLLAWRNKAPKRLLEAWPKLRAEW